VLPSELADLCRRIRHSSTAPWLDSSGPALAAAIAVPGIHLKVNREEAEEALGRSLTDAGACLAAARELVRAGKESVALTLGEGGAVLATADGCWSAIAPPVETATAVASGDAFLGGLVAATVSGRGPAEALGWGVAAGAANALAGGGARFSREQFDALLPGVRTRVEPG
jgi:6-phosphofructokinase 2